MKMLTLVDLRQLCNRLCMPSGCRQEWLTTILYTTPTLERALCCTQRRFPVGLRFPMNPSNTDHRVPCRRSNVCPVTTKNKTIPESRAVSFAKSSKSVCANNAFRFRPPHPPVHALLSIVLLGKCSHKTVVCRHPV